MPSNTPGSKPKPKAAVLPPSRPQRGSVASEAQLYRRIAESTYDWECWFGPDGRLLWTNPSVERLSGYSAAELLEMGGAPLPLLAPEDRASFAELLERAAQGETGNHLEFRLRHRHGQLVYLGISYQALHDEQGRYLGVRTSARDISAQKLDEQELLLSRERAEQAHRAKTEFLATVSHELKTPLHAILGYTKLLTHSALSATQREQLRVIQEQSEQLHRLVVELLDYSWITRSCSR